MLSPVTMAIKQKSLFFPRNLDVVNFFSLLIMFSPNVNLPPPVVNDPELSAAFEKAKLFAENFSEKLC